MYSYSQWFSFPYLGNGKKSIVDILVKRIVLSISAFALPISDAQAIRTIGSQMEGLYVPLLHNYDNPDLNSD